MPMDSCVFENCVPGKDISMCVFMKNALIYYIIQF